jgi:hypothetical protein
LVVGGEGVEGDEALTFGGVVGGGGVALHGGVGGGRGWWMVTFGGVGVGVGAGVRW